MLLIRAFDGTRVTLAQINWQIYYRTGSDMRIFGYVRSVDVERRKNIHLFKLLCGNLSRWGLILGHNRLKGSSNTYC